MPLTQNQIDSIAKIKLFLPGGKLGPPEIVELPGIRNYEDLAKGLIDHHLQSRANPVARNYLSLCQFNPTTGKPTGLDVVGALTALFNPRDSNARNDPRRRDPPSPPLSFKGPVDFPTLITSADKRMKNETLGAGPFELRELPGNGSPCDSETDQPTAIQMLNLEVEDVVDNPPAAGLKKTVPPANAKAWVTGSAAKNLQTRLQTVANEAELRGIIYHEPHHDLTPGMILIDEIFLAMVQAVINLGLDVSKNVTLSSGSALEKDLQDFIIGVAAGIGGGPTRPASSIGAPFGTYILRAGDYSCYNGQADLHVDPARIECFLDSNDKVVAASLIVGAWAGGTHSQGHTSP